MAEDIEKLKYRIGYEFKNRALLREALTHRSYAVESELKYDNQRLEFLGDSILGMILADWLFKRFAGAHEGALTKMRSAMACMPALARIARHLELGNFILLGHGEIESGGADRESTLSDLMEALIGAVYLDSDFSTVRDWLLKFYEELFPEPKNVLQYGNPKGMLQEYTQRKWGCAPGYSVVSVAGPDHQPRYQVVVSIREFNAEGEAPNRKNAEIQAAKNLLFKLSESDPELNIIHP
jgi:ribonuclease-3